MPTDKLRDPIWNLRIFLVNIPVNEKNRSTVLITTHISTRTSIWTIAPSALAGVGLSVHPGGRNKSECGSSFAMKTNIKKLIVLD